MNPLERAVRKLPAPLNAGAKELRHLADPAIVARWRRRTGVADPLPPSKLRARTGSGTSVDVWRDTGAEQAKEISDLIQRATGRNISALGRVLDWGSGAGRVLSRLADASPQVQFSGCDVDADAIAWAAEHHPGIDWAVNGFEPPLPYAAETFDAIYSISILTHLDEDLQFAWLADLRRVLRPGGVALLSVQGTHAYEECRSGRVVSQNGACAREIAGHGILEDEGFIFEPYQVTAWNRRGFGGIDGDFGMTFHSESYIRERWNDTFDIVDVLPRALGSWQDVVIGRRR